MIIQQENPPQEIATHEFAESMRPQEIGSKSYYFSLSWAIIAAWKQQSDKAVRHQIGELEAQAFDAIAAEGFALLDAEEEKAAQ
jgi:hypothetical protein